MNPLMSMLLIVLAALGLIFFLALGSSVLMFAIGKYYSRKHYEDTAAQILELVPGEDAEVVDKLLTGELQPESCKSLSVESLERVTAIVLDYRAEQERIQRTAQDNQKKSSTRGRVRKSLLENKDKGERQ